MNIIFTAPVKTPEGITEFTFEQLPASQEIIYIVCCKYAGEKHCFHLMYHMESAEFKIIDCHNCPPDLLGHSYLLSSAINDQYSQTG